LNRSTIEREDNNILFVITEVSQDITAIITSDNATELFNDTVCFFLTVVADDLISKKQNLTHNNNLTEKNPQHKRLGQLGGTNHL